MEDYDQYDASEQSAAHAANHTTPVAANFSKKYFLHNTTGNDSFDCLASHHSVINISAMCDRWIYNSSVFLSTVTTDVS